MNNIARRIKKVRNTYPRLNERQRFSVIVIAIAIVGLAMVTLLHAAPYVASFEVENGTLGTNAQKSTDGLASGGSFVEFKTGSASSTFSVKVVQDHFVDQNGATLQLHGVNRGGTDNSCTQFNKYADDPGNDGLPLTNGIGSTNIQYTSTMASSLLSWDKPGTSLAGPHAINVVRIPLNEDCWLGINGAQNGFSGAGGANYRNFVKAQIDALTAQHMYVILDLHWAAPGTWLPGTANGSTGYGNGQNVAPDTDHSIAFWQQVATAYKNYPNALFDLFNEPGVHCPGISGCDGTYFGDNHAALNTYLNGGSYTYQAGDNGNVGGARTNQTYQIAGIQQLVTTIRNTGATNPIVIESLGWGGSGYVDEWAKYMPVDPLNQIAIETHSYNGEMSTPTNAANYIASMRSYNLIGKFPFILGEFGGDIGNGNCSTWSGASYVTNTLTALNNAGLSYTPWVWGQGEGCGQVLVSNVDTGAVSPSGAAEKPIFQTLQP